MLLAQAGALCQVTCSDQSGHLSQQNVILSVDWQDNEFSACSLGLRMRPGGACVAKGTARERVPDMLAQPKTKSNRAAPPNLAGGLEQGWACRACVAAGVGPKWPALAGVQTRLIRASISMTSPPHIPSTSMVHETSKLFGRQPLTSDF